MYKELENELNVQIEPPKNKSAYDKSRVVNFDLESPLKKGLKI